MSRLEAHAGFFRLLTKGIFDPYVLWPFDKKFNIEDHDFQGISIKDNCAIKLSTHDNKY